MSLELQILAPGMIALPEVVKDLHFTSAGEAIVVFALVLSNGATSESLSRLPEFNAGLQSLREKGAITVEGTTVQVSLDPLQAPEATYPPHHESPDAADSEGGDE